MRNQSMMTNMVKQIQSNQDQNVDVMRISHNVMRNMQIQKENEAKQQSQVGSQKQRQEKGGASSALGLMPNAPSMNKPTQHAGSSNQGEFDAYNHNVKNRNSKLTRKNTFDTEDEPFDQHKQDQKVDFYKNSNPEPANQPPAESIDKNDFDLGQNTKMVLDFTNGDSGSEQQEAKAKKIANSGSKPKSTSPLQNNFQQLKGATSRNPIQ